MLKVKISNSAIVVSFIIMPCTLFVITQPKFILQSFSSQQFDKVFPLCLPQKAPYKPPYIKATRHRQSITIITTSSLSTPYIPLTS